jgi:hypothetical protein
VYHGAVRAEADSTARRRAQLGKRLLGTLAGIGFCALGAYALLGVRALGDPTPGHRVLWFGITLIVVGLIAIGSSWWVADADSVWCRPPPRRWR